MSAHSERLAQVSDQLHGAFGSDVFGKRAETFARFFGTPRFLIGQTILVAAWITANVVAASMQWDPYPFILLNLAFSLQAAYAAPLILLAQTRQADREKSLSEADKHHREELAGVAIERLETSIHQHETLEELLRSNTVLTEQVERLTREIHSQVIAAGA